MKPARLLPWFWALVESFDGDAEIMRTQFAAMPRRRLFAFCRRYYWAKTLAHPLYWPDLPEDSCPDLSEDYGDDFAAWVVSRGRGFFQEVRHHPDGIQRYLSAFGAVAQQFETCRPDSIAFGTYFNRFGTFPQQLF